METRAPSGALSHLLEVFLGAVVFPSGKEGRKEMIKKERNRGEKKRRQTA